MQSRKVSLTVAFDALHVFMESCVIRGEKSDLMDNYITHGENYYLVLPDNQTINIYL